jgi:serine-type D-Ala-D-Ala carboxypeptidase (penicillin-binding protein 5/6)
VLERGERLAAAAVRYQDDSLSLLAQRPLTVTFRRGQDVETDVVAPEEVEGPVDRGERLGEAVVSVDGEEVGRVALIAARAVPAADIGDRVNDALPGGPVLAWVLVTAALAAAIVLVVRLIGHRRATR